MKSKILLFGILLFAAVLSFNFASAVIDNRAPYAGGIAYGYASYGSYPVNPHTYAGAQYPYSSTPVRIGGWYGANSAFLIGLKPGYYDGPVWSTRTRYAVSSSYYPRAGGWFGGYNSYYGLRPGSFVYGGKSSYSSPSYYFHGTM